LYTFFYFFTSSSRDLFMCDRQHIILCLCAYTPILLTYIRCNVERVSRNHNNNVRLILSRVILQSIRYVFRFGNRYEIGIFKWFYYAYVERGIRKCFMYFYAHTFRVRGFFFYPWNKIETVLRHCHCIHIRCWLILTPKP
jgi:hypothetical protein